MLPGQAGLAREAQRKATVCKRRFRMQFQTQDSWHQVLCRNFFSSRPRPVVSGREIGSRLSPAGADPLAEASNILQAVALHASFAISLRPSRLPSFTRDRHRPRDGESASSRRRSISGRHQASRAGTTSQTTTLMCQAAHSCMLH